MAKLQSYMLNEPLNPQKEYIEDTIDDLGSADDFRWMVNRRTTLDAPKHIQDAYEQSTNTFLSYPAETGIGKRFTRQDVQRRKEIAEELEAQQDKAVSTGISLVGKGLALVGGVLKRYNQVLTSTPAMQQTIKGMGLSAESFNASLYHAIRYWGMLSSQGAMTEEEAYEWADKYVDRPRPYVQLGKDSLKNMATLFSPMAWAKTLETIKETFTHLPTTELKDIPTFAEAMGENYYKTLAGDNPSDAWKMLMDTSFETIAMSPDAVVKMAQRAGRIKDLGASLGIFSGRPLSYAEKAELGKYYTGLGLEKMAESPKLARAELWKINKMKWYNTYAHLENQLELRTIDYKEHLRTLIGREFREPVELPKQQIEAGRDLLDAILSKSEPVRKEKEAELALSRMKKYAKATKARAGATGEQAAREARWALKGEDFINHFDADFSWITQPMKDQLFDIVNALPEWDAQHASTALFKLFDKQIPHRSELEALEMAFGPRIAEQLESLIGRKIHYGDLFTDVMNFPRTMQTAMDLGGILRQGDYSLRSGHAKEWGDAAKTMLRVAGEAKYADEVQRTMTLGPRAALYREAGLARTSLGKFNPLTAREEQYISTLAEKIPVVGEVVKWSERTHTAFLNQLRMNLFDYQILAWQREGRILETKDYKALANYVNYMTGRGDLKTLTKVLDKMFGWTGKVQTGKELRLPQIASALVYAPKYFLSKIQTHTELFFTDSPLVRKMIARDLANYYRTNLQILNMAKVAEEMYDGLSVDDDPTSGYFGYIGAGDIHYNLWGPNLPMVRYLARMDAGIAKAMYTGELYDLDRADVSLRFLRGQLSPAAGLIWSVAKGETFIGESIDLTSKKDLGKIVADTFLPMDARDFYDALTNDNSPIWAKGLAGSAFFGAGVLTVEPSAFQKAVQKKQILSKELFGKTMDKLSVAERAHLQAAAQFDPEIIMLERQGMFEEPSDLIFSGTENQIKADKDIRKLLPKDIVESLDRTFTVIGPVNRSVHAGKARMRLDYNEFQAYKKLIAENIKSNALKYQSQNLYFDSELNEKIVQQSIKAANNEIIQIIIANERKK